MSSFSNWCLVVKVITQLRITPLAPNWLVSRNRSENNLKPEATL